MKIGSCEFPEDLLYDGENLVWSKASGGDFYVGATSPLVWLSGEIRRVQFRPVGSRVDVGQLVASLDGVRNFTVVRSPVKGVVSEVNTTVNSDPFLLNRKPYGVWLCRLKDSLAPGNLKPLSEANEQIAQKLEELKVECHFAFPVSTLYELGSECSAALSKLGDELNRVKKGDAVLLVTDEPTADIEIRRWSAQTGHKIVERTKKGSVFEFLVEKS